MSTLRVTLLQGKDEADVACDVADSPVGLAKQHDMTVDRVAKRALGVSMPADRGQDHGKIVGQVRDDQGAGPSTCSPTAIPSRSAASASSYAFRGVLSRLP